MTVLYFEVYICSHPSLKVSKTFKKRGKNQYSKVYVEERTVSDEPDFAGN